MESKTLFRAFIVSIVLLSACKKDNAKEELPATESPTTNTQGVVCNPSGSNPITANTVKAVIQGDTFNFPFTYGYLTNGWVEVSGLHNRNFVSNQVYPHLWVGFNDSVSIGTYNLGISNSPIEFLTCTLSNGGPIYSPINGSFELLFKDTSLRLLGGKFRTLMVDDPNNPSDSIKVCGEFLKTLTKL